MERGIRCRDCEELLNEEDIKLCTDQEYVHWYCTSCLMQVDACSDSYSLKK